MDASERPSRPEFAKSSEGRGRPVAESSRLSRFARWFFDASPTALADRPWIERALENPRRQPAGSVSFRRSKP